MKADEQVFGLRITKAENDILVRAAEATYRTKSGFMRAVSLQAAKEILNESEQ